MRATAQVGACLAVLGLGSAARLQGAPQTPAAPTPEPTFTVSFDGTTAPQTAAGRRDHAASGAEGVRDARILEIGPHHISLWVNGHSMALVEATGHRRLR